MIAWENIEIATTNCSRFRFVLMKTKSGRKKQSRLNPRVEQRKLCNLSVATVLCIWRRRFDTREQRKSSLMKSLLTSSFLKIFLRFFPSSSLVYFTILFTSLCCQSWRIFFIFYCILLRFSSHIRLCLIKVHERQELLKEKFVASNRDLHKELFLIHSFIIRICHNVIHFEDDSSLIKCDINTPATSIAKCTTKFAAQLKVYNLWLTRQRWYLKTAKSQSDCSERRWKQFNFHLITDKLYEL